MHVVVQREVVAGQIIAELIQQVADMVMQHGEAVQVTTVAVSLAEE